MKSSKDDLSAILIHVRNDVMKATQRKQVPWEHSALTGRFHFAQPQQIAAVSSDTKKAKATAQLRRHLCHEGRPNLMEPGA